MKILRRFIELLRDMGESPCSRHEAWMRINGKR